MNRFYSISTALCLCLSFIIISCSTPPKGGVVGSNPHLEVINLSGVDVEVHQDSLVLATIKAGERQDFGSEKMSGEEYVALSAIDGSAIASITNALIIRNSENVWVIFPEEGETDAQAIHYEYTPADETLAISVRLQVRVKGFEEEIWIASKKRASNIILPQKELQMRYAYTYQKNTQDGGDLGFLEKRVVTHQENVLIPDYWKSYLAKVIPVLVTNKTERKLTVEQKDTQEEHLKYFLEKINGDLSLLPCTSRDFYIPIFNNERRLDYDLTDFKGGRASQKIEDPSRYFGDDADEKLNWELNERECDEVVHIPGGVKNAMLPVKAFYTLTKPGNGSDVSVSPAFEWESIAQTGKEPDLTTQYTVQISTQRDMSNDRHFTTPSNHLDLNQKEVLEAGKTYYWRVSDMQGKSSKVFRFQIAQQEEPIVEAGSDFQHTTDVQTDENGDMYSSGYFIEEPQPLLSTTGEAHLGAQVIVSKKNAQGEEIWTKKYYGSSDVYGKSIALDAQGNTYICGYFWGSIDLDGQSLKSKGGADVVILKITSNGSLAWYKSMGSVANDFATTIHIEGDDLYVAGSFRKTMKYETGSIKSMGSTDVFVTKIDRLSGEVRWVQPLGGLYMDFASEVQVSGQTIYVTGTQTLSQNKKDYNRGLFVSSLSVDEGHVNWSVKGYSSLYSKGTDLTIDSEGNIYVAATFAGVVSFDEPSGMEVRGGRRGSIMVLKLSGQGDVLNYLAIEADERSKASKIMVTITGKVLLAGSFSGSISTENGNGVTSEGKNDILIGILDRDLSIIELRSYGGSKNESAESLSIVGEGSEKFLLLGRTNSSSLKWSNRSSECSIISDEEQRYEIPFRVPFDVNE